MNEVSYDRVVTDWEWRRNRWLLNFLIRQSSSKFISAPFFLCISNCKSRMHVVHVWMNEWLRVFRCLQPPIFVLSRGMTSNQKGYLLRNVARSSERMHWFLSMIGIATENNNLLKVNEKAFKTWHCTSWVVAQFVKKLAGLGSTSTTDPFSGYPKCHLNVERD